ncbi:hypothetical protein D6I17_02700 [Salmonella enterica]|nr:hypothetical protein [Salmonella enterica]EAU2351066.1 hypothetical protein [Salmonella enterica]
MRALPVSELNGPFLCPTHLTKEVCLESNQHLCLARQCSHRCVPVFSPLQARWYAGVLTQPARKPNEPVLCSRSSI